ncbi:hypothetical protein, partial [Salmonella sp. SAL4449]|uniref:hypothetical protein n=1 Tax=Salmonella sp. SAL4449 TaxID=3159904 RepID=UPI003979D67D
TWLDIKIALLSLAGLHQRLINAVAIHIHHFKAQPLLFKNASGQVPLQFSRDAIEQGLLSFGNSAEAEKAA